MARVCASTTTRMPWGWMEPGIWMGSRSQAVRSGRSVMGCRIRQRLLKLREHAPRCLDGGLLGGCVGEGVVEEGLETAPVRGSVFADGVEGVGELRVELAEATGDDAAAEGGAFDDVELAPVGVAFCGSRFIGDRRCRLVGRVVAEGIAAEAAPTGGVAAEAAFTE